MKRIFLLALAIACGASPAADWRSLGKSANGSEMFLDTASVRVSGHIRRAWLKQVPPPDTGMESGTHASKWISTPVMRYAYDCSEANAMLEAFAVYYADGTHYAEPVPDKSWRPVVPESEHETALHLVCTQKSAAH